MSNVPQVLSLPQQTPKLLRSQFLYPSDAQAGSWELPAFRGYQPPPPASLGLHSLAVRPAPAPLSPTSSASILDSHRPSSFVHAAA